DDGQDHPLEFEYDVHDRLITEHQGWGTLRYGYDVSGQLKHLRLPDNSRLEYHRADGGALTAIDLNGSRLTGHHFEFGREKSRQQGLLHSDYAYDDQGRLQAHAVRQNQRPLYRRDYAYSANGNLAQISDTRHGPRRYQYDPLDRLTGVRHGREQAPENFTHDPAGNLLIHDRPGPWQLKGNRLRRHADRHYDYDAYGNLIRERRGHDITAYTYDSQHRLTGLTLPDGRTASYRYDAFGRRINKTVDGHCTQFFWQGDQLVAESSPSHYRSYLYEPGSFRPLAMLDGKGPKKACPFYYQLDHLGTPQELTDYGGEIVWSANYTAYGKVSQITHGGGEQLEQPLRFQGQYFDAESGLHYNRHRYYHPDIGRYLTPDPVKLAGGLNSYRYTPNPAGWVDPLGLACQCPGDSDADGPFSEIVPGGGLAAHEAQGGHLIEKHIDRSEAQLRERLKAEPHIPIASTFPNRTAAETTVSSVISKNKKLIDEFMKGKAQKLVITQPMPAPVGVGVVRDSGRLEALSTVKLILKKTPSTSSGHFILTGYASDK
ncbi:RHS repeat-associated core domain-containing protein, partial [Pseudomonas sp. NFX98]|uniref:RHS repeat-associated core domain-containing protein n=1 Tax=Pseudomonas sp. NFX98 TaxID=3399122 RepID=UPI0039FCBB5F